VLLSFLVELLRVVVAVVAVVLDADAVAYAEGEDDDDMNCRGVVVVDALEDDVVCFVFT
jgi:hypothetical protein